MSSRSRSPPGPAGPSPTWPSSSFERAPAPAPGATPPEPLRLKVVDVLSSQVLAEGVDVRAAVRALEGMRSVVDARIFRWDAERDRWRLLTLEEVKALWAFRGRLD